MTMQLASLEILEQGQFSQPQARAIARAIEAECAARREDLATRGDLHRLELKMNASENTLRAEIHEAKTDMVRWMFSALAGQTLLMMGIMYFLLHFVR